MSGRKQNDECGVTWCDEVINHDGPHRRYLLSGHGLGIDSGKAAVVAVNLQGESARVAGLVLTVDSCQVGLPWSLAQQLGAVVASAVRRWST